MSAFEQVFPFLCLFQLNDKFTPVIIERNPFRSVPMLVEHIGYDFRNLHRSLFRQNLSISLQHDIFGLLVESFVEILYL